MFSTTIPDQRLARQQLARPVFQKAGEVVRWLGGVQAQDYAAAKWAVAQRAVGLTDAALDQALAEGEILRTHVLRPTWHFVAPSDIRWLLALTAPRIHAANALYYRRLGLDRATFKRSHRVLTKALQGGRQLQRSELTSVLEGAGIRTEGLRFAYLIMQAELEGLICSGGREGRQFTYALLDERVPEAPALDRSEALAELTRRYFTSRGPATLQDFVWWSGLTMADAKQGLEELGRELTQEAISGKTYWFAPSTPRPKGGAGRAYLLPNFDEYIVGYTDRSAIFDTAHAGKLDARSNPLFQNTIVLDGRVQGTWKRWIYKDRVAIELNPFSPLAGGQNQAIRGALQKYRDFLQVPLDGV